MKYKIKTFASRVGVGRAALAASVILGANYVSAIAQGILAPGDDESRIRFHHLFIGVSNLRDPLLTPPSHLAAGVFNRRVMVISHSLFMAYLIRSYKLLKPDNKESVKMFYKRIWDIFYLEYLTYVRDPTEACTACWTL